MKMKYFLIVAISLFLFACAGNPEKKSDKEKSKIQKTQEKQLNITFLLDLSDRIDPSKYPTTPSHIERDIAVISEVVEAFRNDWAKKKSKHMFGKIRVLFRPAPDDPNINQIAKNLSFDLTNKAQKSNENYQDIVKKYTENLQKIYDATIKSNKYIGSDVWGFFKNDAKDLAIDSDPNYRNILVVITDGYLYHGLSKMQQGNRYSFITPELVKQIGLNKSDWKDKIEKMDFGLIKPDVNLENLEVLMLEVNPSVNSPYENDVVHYVLEKWLTEMGVKKFSVYNTDLPANTKSRIDKFMK